MNRPIHYIRLALYITVLIVLGVLMWAEVANWIYKP